MNLASHPLYGSEANVILVTDALLKAGHTIFQLYQWPDTEKDHAEILIHLADPLRKVRRILSLGCGVGGMEALWQNQRPEIVEYEMVNISQAQLNRCLVKQATRVCANAETYISERRPFDLVVVAYLLGHVNIDMTLLSALGNLGPGGKLLVYDVFEGTERFDTELYYNTPAFEQLEIFGIANGLRFKLVLEARIPLAEFARKTVPWIADESCPGLFIFQR